MNRLEYIQKSTALMGRLVHEVKAANAIGHFDINTVAEDFFVPILSIVFDCPDLRNQNRIQMNFPAVDLGCATSRTSFQVTSDPSSSKVIATFQKFMEHELHNDFNKLYVFVITEKQSSYRSSALATEIENLPIDFDASQDIIDYRDVAAKLNELSLGAIQRVHAILEQEFAKADTGLLFRANLEKFLEVSQGKIEIEKRTKKYIPSVFVETSKTKEEMRFFANPMFFYRKIDDDIGIIWLDHLNDLLEMAKIEPIANDIESIKTMGEPEGLVELRTRLARQRDVLQSVQELISPFSWHGDQAERFKPDDFREGYWNVFRHPIESGGSGVYRTLDEIVSKIRLTQAKIFLVTGMAGQGNGISSSKHVAHATQIIRVMHHEVRRYLPLFAIWHGLTTAPRISQVFC